ncbi:MAG: DUF4026 domain-containing protein [Phycisphaeraceae bacterium]|nr:DUF4026 domain-containing protein [Phycisphaeraceae bacterium]
MLHAASVLFRGSTLPDAREFAALPGVEVTVFPGKQPDALWSLRLRHPKWGEATLMALDDLPPPPPEFVEIASALSQGEREVVESGTQPLALTTEGRFSSVLRDRKAMLYFGRAVMGDRGVGVVDHLSQIVWSREKLDDELAHDADLDVSQIFSVHAVMDGDEEEESEVVSWLHTHGLAQIGGFDFDILAPSAEMVDSGADDIIRCLAYAVLEGAVKPDSEKIELVYEAPMRFVEVGEFHRLAAEEYTSLREHDEEHNSNRSVICEPLKKRIGGLGGLKRPRPSRFFQRESYEGIVLCFSDTATGLMEQRARATVGVLRGLMEEFAELQFPVLAKLGLATRNDSREHAWFAVSRLTDDAIEGTCENDLHDVEGVERGQQGRWPLEILSDWMMLTPAGSIQPHRLSAARVVREHYDEIREILESQEEE